MPNLPFATANYLVPLDGTTHVVVAGLVATATTHKINWPAFSNDNFSFWPQGAYIDNSGSLTDLTLVVKPIDFSVMIAAGAKQIVSWPAPKNQETWLTGNGPVTIFFVNYPLLSTPAEIDGKLSVTLANGATVTIGGQPISTVAELQAYDPVGAVWANAINQLPADASPTAAGILTTAQLLAYNGATWDRVRVATPADALATLEGLATTAQLMAFNGASWDLKRTPAVFQTGKFTAAGSTALWTPTAGTFFRLMRYKIDVTADATRTTAGDLDIQFYQYDPVGLTDTALPIAETVYIGAVAGTAWSSGWVDLGNGILGTLVNNVLEINLNSALALLTGSVRVTVAGTEE